MASNRPPAHETRDAFAGRALWDGRHDFRSHVAPLLLCVLVAACSSAPAAAPSNDKTARVVIATSTRGCAGTVDLGKASGWKVVGNHLADGSATMFATCESKTWVDENVESAGPGVVDYLEAGDSRCKQSGAIFSATVAGDSGGAVCDLGAVAGHHWLTAVVAVSDGNLLDVQVDLRNGDGGFRAQVMGLIARLEFRPA